MGIAALRPMKTTPNQESQAISRKLRHIGKVGISIRFEMR
jgi:hypothetical protein